MTSPQSENHKNSSLLHRQEEVPIDLGEQRCAPLAVNCALPKRPSVQDRYQELLKREISFRRIEAATDQARPDFIEVYQKAFGGAPYFEQFSAAHVNDRVWMPHLPFCLLVAEEQGKVVGLSCAHPVSAKQISPSACGFLENHNQLFLNPDRTIYFSELAVRDSHRGIGVGSSLVVATLLWANENNYLFFALRTAADGSNSKGIFERFGARKMSSIHQVTEVEGGGGATASTQRIYMGGPVASYGTDLSVIERLIDRSIVPPFHECSR